MRLKLKTFFFGPSDDVTKNPYPKNPFLRRMSSDDDFRPSRPSAAKKMFKHDPEDDSAAGGGGVVSKV